MKIGKDLARLQTQRRDFYATPTFGEGLKRHMPLLHIGLFNEIGLVMRVLTCSGRLSPRSRPARREETEDETYLN